MEAIDLSQLQAVISKFTDEERAEALELTKGVRSQPFIPNPGPQTAALLSEADILLYGGAAGGGKLLTLGQPILTANRGWQTMGSLRVGDRVFGSDGNPCNVTHKSAVRVSNRAYRLQLNTGEAFDCCHEHNWLTLTDGERRSNKRRTPEHRDQRRAARPSRAVANPKRPNQSAAAKAANSSRAHEYLSPIPPQVRTTQEICDTLKVRGRANHSIEVASTLDFPSADLPIDPYILGLWLGDGVSQSGSIGMLYSELLEVLDHTDEPHGAIRDCSCNYKRKQRFSYVLFDGIYARLKTILPMSKTLKTEGSIDKRIPEQYLFSSVDQRIALLQGIMDTDGTVARTSGACEIALSKKDLIEDVRCLLSSLGIKTTVTCRRLSEANPNHADSYKIKFYTSLPAFRLRRKLALQNRTPKEEYVQRRYIVSVDEITPEPMQCISVDSPDNSYLIGETFIVTHNTALEVGCAALGHSSGIILRREATQLDGIIEFSREVLGEIGDYNKVEKLWTFGDGKHLKFAGLNQPDDWRKYAGIARDYMAFDEAGEFLKEQVFSLIGWLRSTKEGQRCRVILGSNPPRGGEGQWMVDEFAPWLEPTFPNRAEAGELRWAIVVGGETEWVDGEGVYMRNGEEYTAMSRTFIPAKLDDNPFLKDTNYRAVLQGLPEPLRSQLLYGDFLSGREDHEWQVIPTSWIEAAQARWTDRPPDDTVMTAIACDVAQGGPDKTQIQARYDEWYGPFSSFAGADTPDGPSVAGEIVKLLRDHARVIVDAGGGYGGDALTQLAHSGVDCFGYKGGRGSTSKSRDGMFGFTNLRSQIVWQFREALDPTYGSQIALPPDQEMKHDLAAFRYDVVATGGGQSVKVGPKDEMKQRLGRSPDKGDTTLMLFASHAGGLSRPKAGQIRQQAMQRTAIVSNAKYKKKVRGR